jgi:hypothetical protein
VPHPDNGNIQVVVKRRTRRHRRNRVVRRVLVAAVLAIFTAGASTIALEYFSPSLFRARQSAPPGAEQHQLSNRAANFNQALAQVKPARTVFRYSVWPGGVEDAKELKWVAEHDPIVAAHYAGFDYDHAQVVRLALAQTVYLSYRIGNRIYWTSHRVKLKKGEKLITDGRMTARTRCANRVEEKPQQEASPAEPTAEKFDQPVGSGDGTAMQAPPVAFQSALLNRPAGPGLEPAGPLSLYNPFTGGSFVPISPPPLPSVCGPVTKKKGTSGTGFEADSVGKKKITGPGPCGIGGSVGTVPEPGTWILFGSGLVFICWQARRRFSRA